MKLLYSRALLSASRTARPCREARYTPRLISRPHPALYQSPLPRSLGTLSQTNPREDLRNEASESTPLPDQVRFLMRRVPYPVAIITSTDPTSTSTTNTISDSGPEPSTRYRGMTVSSFNTVTLTPQPVISFNVRRPSETLNALLASGNFLVHLLSPTKDTAALARNFSRGNQNLTLDGCGFEFVGFTPSPHHLLSAVGREGKVNAAPLPLPMLRRRKDAAATTTKSEPETELFPFIFECRLLTNSVVDVYDHTIVVGTIVREISSPTLSTDAAGGSSTDLCLTYADTRFWEVGKEVQC
ncbi:flavin reductase family protein [Aspergillus lucknowensis]|uniref:Flavin reductase like domain-containing protein n=1 Tax=Aspergillus lucknowensis TaxID=176173 RepID=A0ABR4L8L7_9EURO